MSPRPIRKKVRDAVELYATGQADTIQEAADRVGMRREALSRAFNREDVQRLSACFWQGDEAFKSGAPIDDCPADYSEDKAGWWREGFLRAQEAERPVRATTSSGKINTGASAA